MKKIAIFTEGQTEYIFIRNMIFKIFDASKFCLECLELYSNRLRDIPYPHTCPCPIIHFTIINVGNDERVLSVIKERSSGLNYDMVFGLRDMYSRVYIEKSLDKINKNINVDMIHQTINTISQIPNSDKIRIIFAIMEIEAWFIGMYKIFERYNPFLTVENIRNKLSIDLESINPEDEFFHPTTIINEILSLIQHNYDKSYSIIEKISCLIDNDDLCELLNSNKCNSFKYFIKQLSISTKEIFSCFPTSLN